MQPTTGSSTWQCIHINPDFKNSVLQKLTSTGAEILNLPLPTTTHINPLFMQPSKASTTIHMNPQFLTEKILQQEPKNFPDNIPPMEEPSKALQLNKIISKSRTRIVRESHTQVKAQVKPATQPSTNEQLLLLTKRKLIRATASPGTSSTLNNEILRRKERLKPNKVHPLTGIVPVLKRRPGVFVARFALRRSNSTKKTGVVTTSGTSCAKNKQMDSSITSMNKQLRLININGMLYKSTVNKLQRKIDSAAAATTVPDICQNRMKSFNVARNSSKLCGSISKSVKNSVGRKLYVRGAKYIMDPMGFKLTRVTQSIPSNSGCHSSTLVQQTKLKTNTPASPHRNLPRRIDIGGVTYISSSQSKNVFVRTSTHLVLAHLHNAKQRSVNVLSRSLTKSNKTCLIFQRLGKCAALERNRCSKVHDKQRIILCPKFLQGLCFNTNCLLSHNKTLEKMPVCRFFLQGSCVRNDCPYLHKKLKDDSEICEDFRRGYCALAEQCNKQHVFTKTKPKANVIQCMQNDQDTTTAPVTASTTASTDTIIYRYFNGESFVLGATEIDATISNNSVAEEDDNNLSEHDISDHDDSSVQKTHELDVSENNIEKSTKRKRLGTLPSFIPLS